MRHNEKFAQDSEHNSCALTSDGCMARTYDDSPFRDLELSDSEDSFGMSAESYERKLMNQVAILKQYGKQPMADETIEQFVVRNIETIKDHR